MLEFITEPWPWYISGPLIGLMVPALLLVGNKRFGISSSLRHICAACVPTRIPFFKYDWRKESWNLFLVFGVLIGEFLAAYFLRDPRQSSISAATISVASRRSRSSGILSVLTTYASGALLPRTLGCSLLVTAPMLEDDGKES